MGDAPSASADERFWASTRSSRALATPVGRERRRHAVGLGAAGVARTAAPATHRTAPYGRLSVHPSHPAAPGARLIWRRPGARRHTDGDALHALSSHCLLAGLLTHGRRHAVSVTVLLEYQNNVIKKGIRKVVRISSNGESIRSPGPRKDLRRHPRRQPSPQAASDAGP